MRRESVLAGLVALLLLGSVLLVGVGTVAAQENESGPEPAPDERDRDRNQTESDEPTTVVEEVDEDIRVIDWRYNDSEETFYVILENTGPSSTTVTLTETIDPSQDGAGTFGVRQVEIQPDESLEIGVGAERHRGSVGVMITTPKSLENNQGVYLQDDEGLQIGLFDGRASWTDVRVGVGSAIAGSVVTLIIGSWAVIASRDTDVAEVAIDG